MTRLACLTRVGSAAAAAAIAPAYLDPAARADEPVIVERVTTVVPFPRGMAMLGDRMYVLASGRVRDAGGVTANVNDRAGTIVVIDPDVGQSISEPEVSAAVRANGAPLALPTEPPFRLWRRDSTPPESDRQTDRPSCTLRHHEKTSSFYIGGFSGIDLRHVTGQPSFSKNCSDVILRYDLRTHAWHEVERHHLHAGGNDPHHDPAFNSPPHGWLNGPDNILAVGSTLQAAAKDNSLLVHYDHSPLVADPGAGAPPSRVVFNHNIIVEGE